MRKLPRVLIVEDEPAIAELIAVNLRHNGFQPFWAEDGDSAQRELDAVLPDVILLDWMLPGQSGLALARKWRADSRTKPVPILMLTARGDEPDKIAGLDAGADDYITKPFSTQELLARIRAVLRRARPGERSLSASWTLSALDLVLDRKARRASLKGDPLDLTPKAFAVLEYLMTHPDECVSRERLLEAVWGWEYPAGTRTVDTRMAELRRALNDDPESPRYIETVPAEGYRFAAPVKGE